MLSTEEFFMFNMPTHAECGKTPLRVKDRGSWMLLYNAEVFGGLHQLIKQRSRTCAKIHICTALWNLIIIDHFILC